MGQSSGPVIEYRPFATRHMEAYACIRACPEVAKYLPGGVESCRRAGIIARAQVVKSIRGWLRDGMGHWAVFSGRSLAGICGICRRRGQEPLSVSYAFDPEFWGMGLATRSLGHALNFVSDQRPAFEVIARVYPENTASWKVLSRHGFLEQAESEYPGAGVPWKLVF